MFLTIWIKLLIQSRFVTFYLWDDFSSFYQVSDSLYRVVLSDVFHESFLGFLKRFFDKLSGGWYGKFLLNVSLLSCVVLITR